MRYTYTVAYRVRGLTLGATEQVILDDSVAGVRAALSSEPDVLLAEEDRRTAVANLRLERMFRGGPAISREGVDAQLTRIRDERRERFQSGPYLILRCSGNSEVTSPTAEREHESFVEWTDGGAGPVAEGESKPKIEAATAAIALAADRISGLDEIERSTVYFRDDGKPVYTYRLTFKGRGHTSEPIKPETSKLTSQWYRKLVRDPSLARVVRLLIASLELNDDPLRAFLPAWTGLEVLVAKIFESYRQPFLTALTNSTVDLPKNERQRIVNAEADNNYSIADKFIVIGYSLAPKDAASDVKEFFRGKDPRDALVHGQDVNEDRFPTSAVRILVRKYLSLHLLR